MEHASGHRRSMMSGTGPGAHRDGRSLVDSMRKRKPFGATWLFSFRHPIFNSDFTQTADPEPRRTYPSAGCSRIQPARSQPMRFRFPDDPTPPRSDEGHWPPHPDRPQGCPALPEGTGSARRSNQQNHPSLRARSHPPGHSHSSTDCPGDEPTDRLFLRSSLPGDDPLRDASSSICGLGRRPARTGTEPTGESAGACLNGSRRGGAERTGSRTTYRTGYGIGLSGRD